MHVKPSIKNVEHHQVPERSVDALLVVCLFTDPKSDPDIMFP